MRRVRHYLFLVLLIMLAVVTKAQLLSTANDNITIYLSWKHQFQFAGYYAAIEKGYFKEQELYVTLVENTTNDDVESAVIAGKYNYGVGTAGLLLANDDYKKVSVLAALFQQSAVSLIALKSAGINNLRDLRNGDIVGSIESKAMLKSARVNIDSIRFHGKKVGFDDLLSGKYDAISFYITDQALLLGNDSLLFNIFRPLEYGINFYGECLYANREEVTAFPARAEKLRLAVIKGWEYAVQNPEEIVQLIRRKYNSSLSENELRREADITINKLIRPLFNDIGDMQKSKWEQMANILYDFDLIEEKRDLEGFIFTPPDTDHGAIKTFFIITTFLIAIAVVMAMVQFFYYRQLKKAVAARTDLLEKANQEMDRFVYSISHDIRSPLSSVQGLINLMKIDSSDNGKYLGLIESSIVKLDNYTKDILDYTRNSRAKLSLEQVNLNKIIDQCIDQLKYSIKADNFEFKKDISTELVIWADPWRLEVILNNLLSNAIKYRDPVKENAYVHILATTVNNKFQLHIEDNGLGIDKRHLEKIYDMFYRASEDSQGSGLGLYIVRETINLLGGSIKLTSVKNEGTKIEIELPNVRKKGKNQS